MSLIPKRWHIYTVDLEPRIGTKPGKQRSCLVIQPTEFAESGLQSSVVLPLTTQVLAADAFPLRVRISKGVAGLDTDSESMIDQMLAWDHKLFRKEIGVLPEALQNKIREALVDFLDLI